MSDDLWVSLSEAAKLLGVHPATVRGWADRGLLPSQRTPGGHRRFRRADLSRWMQEQGSSAPSAEAQLVMQSVVGRARMDSHITSAPWYRNISEAARYEMGVLGRQLAEALRSYIGADGTLENAHRIAQRYGEVIREQGLTLSQAVEGFFTFNDFVVDATLQVTELGRADRSESVRKVYSFTREIILALIAVYEK
jgi:excisionase family DNA binding protein